MPKKSMVFTKIEPKETLKVQIDKELYSELLALKKEVSTIDESIIFDIDSICETALKRAIKVGKLELSSLKAHG